MATSEAHPAFQGQLRDWFAGMAMQGIASYACTKEGVIFLGDVAGDCGCEIPAHVARLSYQLADAMMKQSEAAR